MTSIDLSFCLEPVSPDRPSGADLQYDPSYLALFKLAEGKPETQWTTAEEPNWREVSAVCIELLKRSKDLRVVSLLTLASLQTSGVVGLVAGLELMQGMLEQYWPGLYPALDEDDGDATERINIIAALSPPPGTYGDQMRFRQRLAEAPLASSSNLGKFGLRQLWIASGKTPAVGDEKVPDLKTVDAAFADTSVEQLQQIQSAAQRGVAAVDRIDELLTSHVGANKSPDLREFQSNLAEVAATVGRYLLKRGVPLAAGAAAETGNDAAEITRAGSNRTEAAQPAAPGTFNSDRDVLQAIDAICDYYAKNEPSSPVPLLLKRAKRLVSKSFVDILRDLTPDALSQLTVISGAEAASDATL